MTLLDAALSLLALGFAVFPLTPNDKTPLGGRGFLDATKDADHIRYWWRKQPLANIGVATGERSGCWVLDVDNKQDAHGYDTLRQLSDQHGDIVSGYMVATATGGLHIYYRWDAACPVRNHTNRPGSGIDVRGNGGYVVGAGSIRPIGEYVAVTDGAIWHAPDWLLRMVEPAPVAPKPAVTVPIVDVKGESARAREALNRLQAWRADDYEAWVKTGMALHALGLEGLALWEQWSAKSKKYQQGVCERKWQTFDNQGVSLASLFYWAEQDSPRGARKNYAAIITHGI